MADDFLTLATYRFPAEAEAAKMFLEQAGVSVFLADVETVNMDWLLGNAIGYIKLQVPRSQAEQAAALLGDMEKRRKRREAAEEDEEDEEETLTNCLSCGNLMPDDAATCLFCGWSYAAGAEG